MTEPDSLELYLKGQAEEELKAYVESLVEGLLLHSSAVAASFVVDRSVNDDLFTDELVVRVTAEIRLRGSHLH